jgi:hypothetical protein
MRCQTTARSPCARGCWRPATAPANSPAPARASSPALTGTLAGWDYDAALNHSVNTVSDRDVHGYLMYDKTMEGAWTA